MPRWLEGELANEGPQLISPIEGRQKPIVFGAVVHPKAASRKGWLTELMVSSGLLRKPGQKLEDWLWERGNQRKPVQISRPTLLLVVCCSPLRVSFSSLKNALRPTSRCGVSAQSHGVRLRPPPGFREWKPMAGNPHLLFGLGQGPSAYCPFG